MFVKCVVSKKGDNYRRHWHWC